MAAGAEPELARTLKSRHITMIALGGIIGAGLFVTSSVAITNAGPAIVLSYVMAGLLVLFVMRALGEMATATPGLGSFTEYARLGLGNWAGFTTGWLYWYFWAVTVGIEAIIGAKILQNWVALEVWELGGILMIAMAAVNLMSTKSFGEFEFWFASIKVAAIVAFIIIAGGYALGLGAPGGSTFGNLVDHDGFAPFGAGAVFSGVTTVIFALIGAEIATIAAAESPEPSRTVARMTNTIVVRIMLFYVVSIFLVVSVLPWNTVIVGQSPFAQALGLIGVPGAETMMNFIVLTAVLSCLNSGLYVCSRVLFTLSLKRDAPKALVQVNARQVPSRSILLATAVGLAAVFMSIWAENIFAFLVSSTGTTMVFVYIIIVWAQIKQRRRVEREAPEMLTLKMWLFPGLSYLTIVAMVGVVAAMGFDKARAEELWLSLTALAVTLLAYAVVSKVRSPDPKVEAQAAE